LTATIRVQCTKVDNRTLISAAFGSILSGLTIGWAVAWRTLRGQARVRDFLGAGQALLVHL
jgi:hypothetical protein